MLDSKIPVRNELRYENNGNFEVETKTQNTRKARPAMLEADGLEGTNDGTGRGRDQTQLSPSPLHCVCAATSLESGTRTWVVTCSPLEASCHVLCDN